MRFAMKRFSNNNKGVAAIEFAILLPLLIVIIFGIIEFGLLMFNKQVITNACREGCRAGIVQYGSGELDERLSLSAIEQIAEDYAKDHVITFGGGGDPSAVASRDDVIFSDPLTVTVTYHYDFLVLPNFIGSLVGGTDVVAVSVMRQE